VSSLRALSAPSGVVRKSADIALGIILILGITARNRVQAGDKP